MAIKFGDCIKNARNKMGLTQEELAEKLDVSPQTISNWERNIFFPKRKMLDPIASVTGVNLSNVLPHSTNKDALEVEVSKKNNNEDGKLIANRYVVLFLSLLTTIFALALLFTYNSYFGFLAWVSLASTSFFPFKNKYGIEISFDSTADTLARGSVIAIFGVLTLIIVTIPIVEIFKLI